MGLRKNMNKTGVGGRKPVYTYNTMLYVVKSGGKQGGGWVSKEQVIASSIL